MSSHARVVRVAPLAAVLFAFTLACTESAPGGPSPAPTAPTAPSFPALTKPGTIYLAPDSIYRDSQGGVSLRSRFVLYDDGSFALQFAGMPGYTGRYTRTDESIDFVWEGWSGAGPWGSTAFLRGDDLTVKYNNVMLLTDFMDGTYHRVHD